MKQIALILATLASAAPFAHAQYTAYDLGMGHANGINNEGVVVGDNASRAFSYRNGVMTDLGTFGGTSSAAAGINDVGAIVGLYHTISGANHAFRYSGGVMTDLSTLGGINSVATAINKGGTIVGYSQTSGGYYHGFTYSCGVMTDLGTLSGAGDSDAHGINTSGTVVGYTTSTNGTRAYSFTGGVMCDLGTIGGGFSVACGINDVGTIVGASYIQWGNTPLHAFSYAGGVMTDLGALGGTHSVATSINNAGIIVGTSTTADDIEHAFRYRGGVMTDLTPYLSSIGLTGSSGAAAISDSGDIVGYAADPDGIPHAFLLVAMSAPTIIVQPRNQIGYWGKSITLTVGAVGPQPLCYQWQKDGSSIATANGSSLVLTNLELPDAGIYSVIVTNSYGSTTSSNACLTMNSAGVSLALYSGITIDGVVGLTYGIQYNTDLSKTNGWYGMTNVILNAPTELWIDVQPANQPRRYYRVVPGPISIP